jgi:hypothetical protein
MPRRLHAVVAILLVPAALLAAPPGPEPAAPTAPPAAERPIAGPCPGSLDVLCDPCQPRCVPPCGPPGRCWVQGELLLWFVSGDPLPPLVSTAPAGTPRPVAGALGQPGTAVLAGGRTTDYGLLPGFRLRAGMWLDDCQTCGVEGSFFFLARGTDWDQFASPGDPILTRPFFNTLTGRPDTELVAFPGVVAGSVRADNTLTLTGGDLNLRKNLCCTCCGRLDLLAGYRVLHLTEELTVTERLVNLTTDRGAPPGTTIVVQDRFRTENTFHGGQVGLAGERRSGRWYLEGRALVALGVVHQVVEIDGSTAVTLPGQPTVVRPGGLLALPSNIGRHTSDEFAVAPEVGVNLGYQLTEHLRASVGYTFLYLSNVVRPGGVIDLAVDPRQLPPQTSAAATRPALVVREGDFWAQGVSLGLQLRY